MRPCRKSAVTCDTILIRGCVGDPARDDSAVSMAQRAHFDDPVRDVAVDTCDGMARLMDGGIAIFGDITGVTGSHSAPSGQSSLMFHGESQA